jgi:uncharacterized membrane protein YoaK (UPF0700 family)
MSKGVMSNEQRPDGRPLRVRDLLLMALTVSSGAVDAIAYLALGKVFTAFMTGNLVFLGLVTAGAGGPSIVSVAIALAVFAAGVFLSARIVKPSKGSGVWPRRVTIALGVAAVAQACFLAVWVAAAGLPASGVTNVLIGLSALAMGMQTATVFSLGLPGVFTTAATATLTVLMSDVASWSQSATERRRLAGMLVSLFAGATAGSLLLVHARTYAPVLPLAVTILVVATAEFTLRARDATDKRERR